MYGKRGKLSPFYGIPRSSETKRLISIANKGRKVREDTKLKISNTLKSLKRGKTVFLRDDIIKLRYEDKLSQSAIAERLGLHQTAISKFLSMNLVKAKNPTDAWEKILENFLIKKPDWFCEGVGYNLTDSLFTYDLMVEIADAKFDPDFDFGKMFGYTMTKWTGLITNYLDLDVLDQAKLMIRKLEENKTVNRNYHIGFHFADNHGSGKGCLVGGIFSRKIGVENPEITVILRSSEIVTRLPIDILLFCRMGQYIYGHDNFSLKLVIKAAWANDTTILLYQNRKDIKEFLKENCSDEVRRKKIRKSLKKLMTSDEAGYKTYGNSFRAFKVLRRDLGYKQKSMLASALEIGDWDGIPLPEVCPSILKRNMIKKTYLKFTEKYGLKLKLEESGEKKRKKLISFSSSEEDDMEDGELTPEADE